MRSVKQKIFITWLFTEKMALAVHRSTTVCPIRWSDLSSEGISARTGAFARHLGCRKDKSLGHALAVVLVVSAAPHQPGSPGTCSVVPGKLDSDMCLQPSRDSLTSQEPSFLNFYYCGKIHMTKFTI